MLALAALSAGAQTSSADLPPGSIPLLQPQQMSPEHASVATAMQDSVARSAGIYGFTLDSSYDYREIACPFAPRDVLLAYESVSPSGAISRFTAVLSPGRSGRSPVQIIPILHFGVTPFVPAYSNPHSIELFNQAVDTAPVGSAALAEIQLGRAPIVLRGLCYLAMIGAEPSALRSPSLEAATMQAPVPTLQILEGGRTRQLISIRNTATTYQVWTLTFSSGGRLLASSREERPVDRQVLLEAATPAAAPSMGAPAAATNRDPSAAKPPMPEVTAVASPEIQAAETKPASPSTPPGVAETPIPLPPPAAPPPVSASATIAVSPVTQPVPVAAPPPVSPPAVAEAPVTEPSIPVKDAAVTPPASVALPAPATAAMVAPPSPVTRPVTPAASSLRATQILVPEPRHRFIPDPPPPPHRFIPASALQTPPHLPQ